MKSRSYRLGEYRITEYDGTALSWERHAALAEQRSGRCFVLGDLLIIGPCRDRDTGYLSGEFFDRLRELPSWNRTRYSCDAGDLLDAVTGQRVAGTVLEERAARLLSRDAAGRAPILVPGNYRVGRYKVTVGVDGKAYWQSHEGLQGVAAGRCILESAVLFIGPRESETQARTREAFSDELARLPRPEHIVAWGYADALQICRHEEEDREEKPRQDDPAPLRIGRDALRETRLSRVLPEQCAAKAGGDLLRSLADRLKAVGQRCRDARFVRRDRKAKERDAAADGTRPAAEVLPASSQHRSAELRNSLLSAVVPLHSAWTRMVFCKGWMKWGVPIAIIVLLGAAAGYVLLEDLWEDHHLSGEHHSGHHH